MHTTEHFPTVIVGAGQAGLATGYHLQQRGHPFVILEAADRVGDGWRHQWDTLRLYTPARYDALPGLPFPAPDWTYPGKEDIASYLEDYAGHWQLPVRTGTRVLGADQGTEGGFVLTTTEGTITCESLVVATGPLGREPYVPDLATGLSPEIVQLHSSQYRRPGQLADGPVLVVGASHSGTDIAYEVAATHPTTLAGRDCGQVPFRLESPAARVLFPVLVFAWRHVLTRRTPVGRHQMEEVRKHGGPMIRVKRTDLAARGVVRTEARVVGVSDGMPLLDDQTVVEATTVIWATGFRHRLGWLRPPALGADGWPAEYRGVAEQVPGLFFCGLSYQFAFSSMVLPGVGRDAAFVARRVVAHGRPGAHATAA